MLCKWLWDCGEFQFCFWELSGNFFPRIFSTPGGLDPWMQCPQVWRADHHVPQPAPGEVGKNTSSQSLQPVGRPELNKHPGQYGITDRHSLGSRVHPSGVGGA